MGLFSVFDERPGPGVRPDEPRKRGFARWREVIGRDLWKFWRAGMTMMVASLPYLLGMYFAIITHAVLILLAACVIGGLIAGPFFCGLVDTILRSLRDEPGFLELGWRRAMKQNWKDSLFPGALCCTLYGVQVFTVYHLDTGSVGLSDLLLLVIGFFVTTGFFIWFWPQIALLDAPLPAKLKNAVLFAFTQPLRTLGGALFCLFYLTAMLLFAPYSFAVFLFTGFWLPLSVALLAMYQPMEKAFHLEDSIRVLQEKERSGKA